MRHQKANHKSQRARITLVVLCVVYLAIVLFAPACKSSTNTALDEKIKRIESGLLKTVRIKDQPYEKMTLADRMAAHKVPAISVAVVKDNKIEWAKAYKTKVTLRQILSHSAGLAVHGFLSYPTGQSVPILLQVLNSENPDNGDGRIGCDKMRPWKKKQNGWNPADGAAWGDFYFAFYSESGRGDLQ